MPSRTFVAGQIGGYHGREAFAQQHLQGVTRQGQFEQDGLVLEEIEAVAGHPGPRLEVDQAEPLAQLDVVQRLEIERRQGRLAAEQLEVGLVVDADRGVGVRDIGDRAMDRLLLDGDGVQFRLDFGGPSAEVASLGLQRFAFRLVLGLADGFREFVRLAIELFDLGLQGLPPAVEGDEAINVGLGAAMAAILLDEFGVFDDEFAIEHGSLWKNS